MNIYIYLCMQVGVNTAYMYYRYVACMHDACISGKNKSMCYKKLDQLLIRTVSWIKLNLIEIIFKTCTTYDIIVEKFNQLCTILSLHI